MTALGSEVAPGGYFSSPTGAGAKGGSDLRGRRSVKGGSGIERTRQEKRRGGGNATALIGRGTIRE